MTDIDKRRSAPHNRRKVAVLAVAGIGVLTAASAASLTSVSAVGQKPPLARGEFLLAAATETDSAVGFAPFDRRIELGEEAERREEFRSFHAAVERAAGDHLAETMRSCFATVQNPNTATFVLVADIGAEGTATAIEVRPATNIARCFAAGVATARFPVPPPHAGHDGFPITIKMRID